VTWFKYVSEELLLAIQNGHLVGWSATAKYAGAPKARDMIARGKREARRPWLNSHNKSGGLKGRNSITPFQGCAAFFILLPGATRFALAPGYHIPRLRRWVSYFDLRHWLSYGAPLALQS
jgi:hypothetical protein